MNHYCIALPKFCLDEQVPQDFSWKKGYVAQ